MWIDGRQKEKYEVILSLEVAKEQTSKTKFCAHDVSSLPAGAPAEDDRAIAVCSIELAITVIAIASSVSTEQ